MHFRRLVLPLVAATAFVSGAPPLVVSGQTATAPASQEIAGGADFQPAPAYVALFAPRAHRDAYAAYVSPHPLDEVLRRMDALDGPPPVDQGPFDAFGQGGSYDRWTIARLFGPRRVRVARRPRVENGRVVEAWTLTSPYPDARLERFEPGTLLLVLRVPPL